MNPQPANKRWQRYVPAVAGTLIVVLVTSLLIWFVRGMLNSKPSGPTRAVEQKITMIRPTPPPEAPPPPPPEEKIEQPIEQAEPEQAPDTADAAPAEALGLDADGAAGADGFGLAAARKGGRDLVGTGTAPFRWYTNLIQSRLQECFSEDERIRKGSYKANIKVRVAEDGRLDIVDLLGSTGSAEKDAAIRSLKKCNTGESRPLEMPQLATIQIVSRG